MRAPKFKFHRIPNGKPQMGFEFRIQYSPGRWTWKGSVASSGYGTYPTYKKYLGTAWAHRISYLLYVGPIEKGLEVMHNCDNKLCVNPLHLSLGNRADNEREKVLRGRTLSGVSHPQARLTVDEVLQIRNSPLSGKILSQTYGVSPGHISNIRNGNSWKNE